jgi:hypothetical protein
MIRQNQRIERAIAGYIRARRNLIVLGQEHPELIGGNDNIIGRIGEYYAIKFLKRRGQLPIKALHSSTRGYDLKDTRSRVRTQVKVISTENKSGRTVRLTEPWDQLVLILLGDSYRPLKIGLLTKKQFVTARREHSNLSRNPYVKKTMLGINGIIGKYGTIEDF